MLDSDISTADAIRQLSFDEPIDRLTLDRRRFLQLVGMGIGAGLVGGGASSLLDHLPFANTPAAWAVGPSATGDGILVVIGMYGGNDGLNTVIPTNDGLYQTQHGSVALPPGSGLPLASGSALHPELTELKRLWDAGNLAIVEGIGTPKLDLSHFSSMATWMGGQTTGIQQTGWIGRWLDGYLAGTADLYAAAEIGHSAPLHIVGAAQRGTVVPTQRPPFGASADPTDQRAYSTIRAMRSSEHGTWHGLVSQAFADQIDLAANVAPFYPDAIATPEIVGKLEVAARLINANLGFRVLTAGWNDFDSHAKQPAMHNVRMTELNAAIKRFFELLDPTWSSRVTIMTFSEFGRTSWSNDGQGTDHGSSAPHFVLGTNVRGGFYGQRPTLAGLGRWDRMAHHVDFRSYYASIIDGWLGGGSSDILGGAFENLGLFARPPGQNADGSVAPSPGVVTAPSMLVPIAPFRVIDTRDGTGGVLSRALGPGERIRVPIAGVGAIPSAGVTAVAANVTAVGATMPNFFTVYPGSTVRPGTSNLNSGPGRPIPNLVVMGVGSDGMIEVFNSHGDAHCLVDVFGYFTDASGDRFNPLSPQRLFDTRTGQGIRAGKIPGGTAVDVQVAGLAGVPSSGASAVVMNFTVTEPETPGWMRVTPSGQSAATTSNVNFDPNDTTPNLVICKLGSDGRIAVDGHGTGAHVLGDVFGYFGADGQRLRTLPPQRLLDTREGVGALKQPVGPDNPIRVHVTGRARIPEQAVAIVLNVTATNVSGPSFVTVWPDDETQPDTSNLNVITGQTVANLVICRLGGGGLRIASPVAPCDLVADVLGYFIA